MATIRKNNCTKIDQLGESLAGLAMCTLKRVSISISSRTNSPFIALVHPAKCIGIRFVPDCLLYSEPSKSIAHLTHILLLHVVSRENADDLG